MPTEGFFQRWSRLKTEPAPAAPVPGDAPHERARALAPAPVAIVQPGRAAQDGSGQSEPLRQPTLDDVAQLRADSDYSAFVARGVDKSVQRSALKKLFADPHFNMGDGLDLYMGDYNKPDPIPAAMMSALRHTQSFFAQAYPDRKTEDEDTAPAGELALGDDRPPRADELAIKDQSASPANLIKPEPQMTDTTGASSAASEDQA